MIESERAARQSPVRRMLRGAGNLPLALVLAVALLDRTGLVQGIHVSSINMVPTLAVDDRVVVTAWGRDPGAGDVVVYHSPFDADRLEIGRIVAAEGSRVELDDAGLHVDDAAVAGGSGRCAPAETACSGSDCLVEAEAVGSHCYFTRRAGGLGALMFPATVVPAGHVFILNDNRVDERDSRIYGAIPRSAIVGVASFVYYASDQTGIRWDRMTRRVS